MLDPTVTHCLAKFDVFAVIDPSVSVHHLPLIYIPGYTLFHSLRVDTPPLSIRVHGGVLLYVKNCFSAYVSCINLNQDNNYDQLIVRIGDVVFAFVYMPQPQSTIHQRVPVPVWDALLGDLSHLYHTGESMVIMGDLNAHTANSTPYRPFVDPPANCLTYRRVSSDRRVDTYGNELLRLCRSLHLQIANGFLEKGHPTFLGNGDSPATSVIDYMLFSESLYENGRVTGFSVLPPICHLDHTPICCEIQVTFKMNSNRTIKRRLRHHKIPSAKTANEADGMLDDLMVGCRPSPPLRSVAAMLVVPESLSSAALRRRMTAIADSPGFRSNEDALKLYKDLSKTRLRLQKSAREKAAQSVRERLLGC